MVRFLYFFVSLVLLSCGQTSLDEDLQAMNVQELQAYNQEFKFHNFEYYAQVDKIRVTVRAQGGGILSTETISEVRDWANMCEALLDRAGHSILRANRVDDGVNKMDLEAALMSQFSALRLLVLNDSLHLTYNNNERIDYQRNYTEEEFENDLSRYQDELHQEFKRHGNLIGEEEWQGFMITCESLVFLAERKALLFLFESLGCDLKLNSVATSTVRADYEGVVHQAGEKIKLELQPLKLFESSLLSHQYHVFFEDTEQIYDLKGAISPRVDTIWLPTDKVGNYRIEGQSIQDGRVERTRSWVYEYKVIAP
jgi:hypothetical protein